MTKPQQPSRIGVRLDRHGAITVPGRPRSWSIARYVDAYDQDPVIVWTRTVDRYLVRTRLAGPLSARGYLSQARPGERHVVVWEADDVDALAGERPTELAQ